MLGFAPLGTTPFGTLPLSTLIDPSNVVTVVIDDRSSATTAVSICSNALRMLGDTAIESFEEGTERAARAGAFYPMVRDMVLRRHPWNCCIKRVQLAPETAKPSFEYGYQFLLPADCSRVLSIDSGRGGDGDYQVEGRKVLTNMRSLFLRYVFRNLVESTYDDLLVSALTVMVAARLAYATTGSTTLYTTLMQDYELAIKQARAIDGQENPPDTFGDFPLLAARY